MALEHAVDVHELASLTAVWGAPVMRHNALTVGDPFLTGEHQLLTRQGRRAEICYVMHAGDPRAGVLLHRKTYYPEEAYRLPTGGVHVGERVSDTLVREVFEETGLVVGQSRGQVQVERFLGVLVYDLLHTGFGQNVPFATYHFLVRMPSGGVLAPQDPEESIAGWRWRPAGDLPEVADTLEQVHRRSATWADWGRFRALSHRFVAEVLVQD